MIFLEKLYLSQGPKVFQNLHHERGNVNDIDNDLAGSQIEVGLDPLGNVQLLGLREYCAFNTEAKCFPKDRKDLFFDSLFTWFSSLCLIGCKPTLVYLKGIIGKITFGLDN